MSEDVSTRFPFINLEKALARASQLFAADKAGRPMLVPVAFEVWGYSPKSSGAFQTVAALKQYGLIDDEGANDDRRVRISDAARRYFLDERDEVRAGKLGGFALAPPLFRTLWEADGWSAGVPADTVARSHLKLERNLNDQSARSLLSIFKENIQFAGLKAGLPMTPSVESPKSEIEDKPRAEPEGQKMQASTEGAPKESKLEAPAKPILFDMESVTISTQIKTAEDLREFIEKLERLEPLMPKKEH